MADKNYQPTIYKRDGGNTINFASGSVCANDVGIAGPAQQVRVRVPLASVNAGATILAALPGYAYRLHDCTLISVGGAAAGATAVVIQGVQSTSTVSLISAAVAALTQSAIVKPNTASVTVLADGASLVACDANTAITIAKTGSSLTTSTNIDVLLTFSIETQ